MSSSPPAPPAPQEDLAVSVATGVSWSALARVGAQLMSFVSIATVARLLQPTDYGIVGMAQAVIGLVALFREAGLGLAIIQRREIPQALLSTAFWTTVVLGVLIAAACFGIAPAVADFYREPVTEPVFRALSISFLINSASTVSGALLNRRMRFKTLAIVEIAAAVISFLVALGCALSGMGFWSLVFASLSSATVSSGLTILFACWRPSVEFHWLELRSVLRFGLNYSGFNIVNYFARNADNVIVGRFLGASPLGLYQFAYQLMLYPVQSITWLLGRVLLPAFARMQDDNQRLRTAYLRATAAIALLTFPMMMGLLPLSHHFIAVVLGPKWLGVAPVLAILAPVGMVQSLVSTTGQIFVVKQRTDKLLRLGLVCSSVMVASFFAGLPWGIRGVASAYAIANGVLLLPTFLITFRLIELKLIEFWRAVRLQGLAACVMYLCVIALRTPLTAAQYPDGVVLASCTALGASVYAVALLVLRPPVVYDVLRLASAMLGRRETAESP